MPKFDFEKNFQRVYIFYKIYEIYSPSKSKRWKGGNYICFLKMDIASKWSRLKHKHPSLLYALCSVPSPAKIRGKNLGSLTCSFFICYHVNIRLIIPLQFPKKRNI